MAKMTEKELEDLWMGANTKLKLIFDAYNISAESSSLDAVRFTEDKDRMERAKRIVAIADALANAKIQVDIVIANMCAVVRKCNAQN